MSTKSKEPSHLKPNPSLETLAEMERRFTGVRPRAVIAVLQLINLGRGISASLVPHFEKIGLTEARFTSVMMIYRTELESGYATPSQLADHAGIGRAAMSQLLDGLAEANWIQRELHPQDRRKIMVKLTPRGRRQLEAFLPQHYQRIADAMSNLSDSEMTSLIDILGKVGVR